MPVSRVPCRYPGPRESVHIKLLVSPVSFSHNNVRLLMVYSPYGKFAYRATCRLIIILSFCVIVRFKRNNFISSKINDHGKQIDISRLVSMHDISNNCLHF